MPEKQIADTKPHDVIISVQSVQRSLHHRHEGGSPPQVELITGGTMTRADGKYIISYPETELTGLEGTQTTFEVAKDSIKLTRTGTVTSELVFEEGRKHESLYDMGFGAMLVGVRASKVQSALDDNGGLFRMEYTIEIEHEPSAQSQYLVSVRKA